MSNDPDVTVKKLVILSECAVYKDIIPGYRIRIPTEKEQKVRLSKEVRALREYEATLLSSYQKYLQYLESIIKSPPSPSPGEKSSSSLVTFALKCLIQLLCDLPHFNFRSNIIQTIVPLMNSRIDSISEMACRGIETLFKKDRKGEATLEIVRTISQMIKANSYKSRPQVLRTFLVLNLSEELEEGIDIINPKKQKEKKYISKKERKKSKEEKKLEQDLKKAEAEENRDERKRIQREILTAVFLTYFRILKKAKHSNLLPYVLEGLARFAHLINVELLVNLLQVLRELVTSQQLSIFSSLHCALTAFQTLKLGGETLNIDLKTFYTEFYSILFQLIAKLDEHNELIPVTLQCLQSMLYEQKQLSLDRAAAYIKRVLMLATYLPPHSAIALLHVAHDLLKKYPKTQQLLDCEVTGTGEYHAEIDDPEHCNPFATSAWEFALLMNHYHPTLAKFSEVICNQQPLSSRKTALELFYHYNPFIPKSDHEQEDNKNPWNTIDEWFIPSLKSPSPHPLQKKLEKYSQKVEGKSKKQKQFPKAWFIQPQQDYPPSDFLIALENVKQQQSVEI